jgi:ribosomal protein L14
MYLPQPGDKVVVSKDSAVPEAWRGQRAVVVRLKMVMSDEHGSTVTIIDARGTEATLPMSCVAKQTFL